MRRVRDSSQYRNRERRNDVMDGVRNVLGENFIWPPALTLSPSLITESVSTSKILETQVSEAPDTLAVPSTSITVLVSTAVE